jgi:hypothetical protein
VILILGVLVTASEYVAVIVSVPALVVLAEYVRATVGGVTYFTVTLETVGVFAPVDVSVIWYCQYWELDFKADGRDEYGMETLLPVE